MLFRPFHFAMSLALVLAWPATAPVPSAFASSLRFHGNGVNDVDRVKIRVDDPATSAPGPAADVGAGDFTLELWLRGTLAENDAGPRSCGANIHWIYGNVVLDRDRFSQDRKFGLSLVAGVPIFGVSPGGAYDFTICGTGSVLDGAWHHIAVQRRVLDGRLWMFVDGVEVANEAGPEGPLDYPDDGVPGSHCGGPCTNSDPFIVFGAEKHDAGSEYPSFSGWLDEVRFSNVLRYSGSFVMPGSPFLPDASTAGLWHFDEAAGDTITDSAPGGASGGRRHFGTGGSRPAGPEWSADSPFAVASVQGSSGAVRVGLRAWPSPSRGAVWFHRPAGETAMVIEIFDANGRRIAELAARAESGVRWDGRDAAGRRVPAGLYLARVRGEEGIARVLLLH